MKTSRIAAAVLLTFLSTTVPRGAFAQDDPVTLQARARFKEGVDFYDKGQYENARLAFLQAYALKKHPAVLLNLAQSTAKAGHALEAAKYFQQFLKESPNATPQQQKDAEGGLAEVRQKLGRIEIIAPAGTEITLDEKDKLGTAPFAEPIDVEPGAHALKSSTETVRVTANAGQRVQARFGGGVQPVAPVVAPVVTPVAPLPPAANPPPGDTAHGGGLAVPPAADQGPTQPKEPITMVPGYVAVGVAGVGVAGAIIFAAFKADAQSKADAVATEIRTKAGPNAPGICSSTDPATVQRFGPACQTLRENNDKVDTNATIANVSLGVAIVGGIFAAAWLIAVPVVNRKRARESAPQASTVTPKSPHVTPYAGYNNGGFVFSGEF